MSTHTALVGAVVFTNDGMNTLRDVFRGFSGKDLEIQKTSSVYQVLGSPQKIEHVHDLKHADSFFGLSVCLKVKTALCAKDLLNTLEKFESCYMSSLKKRTLSLNLLFYDSETKMTPRLCLPYPEFHMRAEFVMPAAEVWGDYVHPVLNEELKSLTRRFVGESWGEFYAQSSELGLASASI